MLDFIFLFKFILKRGLHVPKKKEKGRANAKQSITVKGGNLWNDLKIERKL